jgi:ATP-binding cassette, subfamily B, bacterial
MSSAAQSHEAKSSFAASKRSANNQAPTNAAPPKPRLFGILTPYRKEIAVLIVLALVANVFTLWVPQLIAHGIDSYVANTFDLHGLLWKFLGVVSLVFFFTVLQSIVQTVVSERVARDLRQTLATRISRQAYRFIEEKNPSKLLTNLTSDIDAIKMFVAQVIVSLVTSAVIIIGTAIILLSLDWQLALVVLLVIPLIGGTFFVILRKVRPYFMQARGIVDGLNKVIMESIVGAALIRLMDAGRLEHGKFDTANQQSRDIGFSIVRLFAFMIPIITFVASMGTLTVVTLGGSFVINGEMSLGSYTAFMNYLVLLIFPILVIGFMSNIIAQANASYVRISEVLNAPDDLSDGTHADKLTGAISVRDLNLSYGGKPVLKQVSLAIKPHSRTAILGPTAAGKTQLLNLMAGLTPVTDGVIEYDGKSIASYQRSAFYPQIGLVFQDSVLFNTSLRENIAFSSTDNEAALALAIATAELSDFVASLPAGLDTQVSERGTTLSGGQKQRLMLARALVQNPTVLFLDDFTARVDANTEQKILANIARNYPALTLVSITQKIAPVQDYDQIILLMEGEILAVGQHDYLMHHCPEYVQIYNSQRSTNTYELRS